MKKAMTRPGLKTFQQHVDEGGSNDFYLKAPDFDSQRRVKIIPWIFNGNPTDIFLYREGWEVKEIRDDKTNKITKIERPVRVGMDEKEPEGIVWKIGSYKGGPERPQTPRDVVSGLIWDYQTSTLKMMTFTQTGFIRQINEYLAPEVKDKKTDKMVTNETYVPDFTEVDLVIKRVDEKNFTITIKDNTPMPKEALKALEAFRWSWEEYMAGNSPREDDAYTWADVCDVIYDDTQTQTQAAQPAQEKPKPEANKNVSNQKSDWKSVKTPKGAILGEQTLETLKGWKKSMDDSPTTNKESPLYKSISSGIVELESAINNLADAPDVAF